MHGRANYFKMYSKGEVILVISVFLFVFGCFSIPIILHDSDGFSNLILSEIIETDFDNCPLQQVIKQLAS